MAGLSIAWGRDGNGGLYFTPLLPTLPMLRLRLMLLSALLLAACGQAGPLYLPERSAAPAPTASPAPAATPAATAQP